MEDTAAETTVEATAPAPIDPQDDNTSEKIHFQGAAEIKRLSGDDGDMEVEATSKIETEGGETTTLGEGEEGEVELSTEALEKIQKEKKRQKREQKRLAREKLDKHYKAAVSEPDSEPEPEPEPDQEALGEPETIGEMEEDKISRELTLLRTTLVIDEKPKSSAAGSMDQDAMDEVEGDLQYSSSDERTYERRACSVSFKDDFLQYFMFPSISDISSDSESEEYTPHPSLVAARQTESVVLDIGRFVDPLTGEEQSTPSPIETDQSSRPVEEEESESESESESISFDWPFPLEDEVPTVKAPVDAADMAMEMLMEIQGSVGDLRQESTTAMEQERAARDVRQIVFDFVHKLIDDVVEIANYVDPAKILRAKLDKKKMHLELVQLFGKHMATKQFNTDLNHKMYEYYRRVGQLRCFDQLSSAQENIEFKRLREAFYLYDHLKEKAEQTKITNSALLASVKLDLEHVSCIALASVNTLEDCVRKVILRKDAEFLPRIVENELRRMQAMRNEISDSRLWLITRQHTLGRLVERKFNFNQITEDLTMDQFLLAQRDVTALGTKVEERNNELNRMRDRCTKHMHQLAFIREKTSMISATLHINQENLTDLRERQDYLRDELLKLKLQHARLKAQKNELHEKCGLLFKPALLHDFDKTSEFVETKRERVHKLRNVVQDLESRISEFEEYSRSSTMHSIVIPKKKPKHMRSVKK